MKSPFPSVRALAEYVRADDDRAINHVIAVLKRNKGNVRKTAESLGCGKSVLYAWRDGNPRLKAAFEELAMGRTGAGKNATRARMEGDKS